MRKCNLEIIAWSNSRDERDADGDAPYALAVVDAASSVPPRGPDHSIQSP